MAVDAIRNDVSTSELIKFVTTGIAVDAIRNDVSTSLSDNILSPNIAVDAIRNDVSTSIHSLMNYKSVCYIILKPLKMATTDRLRFKKVKFFNPTL